MMSDPYDILGVARDASAADIKRAFHERGEIMEILRQRGYSDDEILIMHPNYIRCEVEDALEHLEAAPRLAEFCTAYAILGDERKRQAFDRGEIDAEGEPRPAKRGAWNAANPLVAARKPARHRRWLTWICVLAIGSGALIYFHQSNQSAQSVAQTERTCGTSRWRTNITLDGSRPELVSTTLRSRNAVGQQVEPQCVDVILACRQDGPYFEVRLGSSGSRIQRIGPLVVNGTGNTVNVSVSGRISEDGSAVRISEKVAVEVLASVLDDGSFTIPLTLANGEDAVARFLSFDLFPAIRPVLVACNLRSLRSVGENAE